MKTHTKLTALVSTILLTSALAGPAKADTPSTESLAKAPTTSQLDVVKADNAPLTFERSMVTTTPAPKVVEPAPVEAKSSVAAAPVAAPVPVAARAAAPVAPKPAVAPKAAPAAPVAPAPASGNGAAIAAAAYAQLGVAQDCTALATKSIAAVGINFHGWPAGYLSLGRTVSAAEAQPGDLAYYQNGGSGLAHIAVYVGGGKAVHGGWNGGTTSLQSVNVGSGPVFIRVV